MWINELIDESSESRSLPGREQPLYLPGDHLSLTVAVKPGCVSQGRAHCGCLLMASSCIRHFFLFLECCHPVLFLLGEASSQCRATCLLLVFLCISQQYSMGNLLFFEGWFFFLRRRFGTIAHCGYRPIVCLQSFCVFVKVWNGWRGYATVHRSDYIRGGGIEQALWFSLEFSIFERTVCLHLHEQWCSMIKERQGRLESRL